jgi:hypothetical protein
VWLQYFPFQNHWQSTTFHFDAEGGADRAVSFRMLSDTTPAYSIPLAKIEYSPDSFLSDDSIFFQRLSLKDCLVVEVRSVALR